MKTILAATLAACFLLGVTLLVPGTADEPAAEENPQAAAASPDEIALLREWVDDSEAAHQRVHALWAKGARGGAAEDEAMSRYYMCLAKARLAEARQDLAATREWYGRAVTAADDTVQALQEAYNVGLVTLDVVLLMQQNRAEVKIALGRLG